MPPRLNLVGACRSLAIRSRPPPPPVQAQRPRLAVFARHLSDGIPRPPPPPAAAAEPATIPPSSEPPIESILPEAVAELAQRGGSGSGSSTAGLETSRAESQQPAEPVDPENEEALRQLSRLSQGLNPFNPKVDGHKYGIPETPWKEHTHLKDRYDPVLAQVTRLMMRHGKLAKAQRDMAMILNHLRTSPPPRTNPARPLLPGSPSPSHLPLYPALYLTLAIDSVAPLFRIRQLAGIAGGGRTLPVPMPLRARQRRRIAFQWILDAVAKRPNRGSGRRMFPARVAQEVIAVAEGTSPVWEKRQLVHKMGTASRANLNHAALRKKR